MRTAPRRHRAVRRTCLVGVVVGCTALLLAPPAASDGRHRPPVATGPATALQVTAPSEVTAGRPFRLRVRAVDAEGRTVPGYRGTVRLTAEGLTAEGEDDPPVDPGWYTFSARDRGDAHVRTTVLSDTIRVIVAQAGSTYEQGRSNYLRVRPGRAASLALALTSRYPNVGSGELQHLSVRAQDRWGNTAPWPGPVTFSVSDQASGAGVAPHVVRLDADGTALLVPPDGLTLVTPGEQTVTARSGHLRSAPLQVYVRPPEPPGPQLDEWGVRYPGEPPIPPWHVPGQWRSVGAGDCQWLGVRTNGTLWRWGADWCVYENGYHINPEPISTSADWVAVDAGIQHGVALRTDGSAWLWGEYWGRTVLEPVRIGTDPGWVAVSSAVRTYLVGTDGTLWAVAPRPPWGVLPEPTRIGDRSDWVHVQTEERRVVAITADGTLWEWTHDGVPASGDEEVPPPDVPALVPGDQRWRTAATSGDHVLAVARDGTLWAWGANGRGQLGDGTTSDRAAPVQVGTGSGWRSVAATGEASLATRDDGTLWGWGSNDAGDLGDGATEDRLVPTRLGDATDWLSVSSGVLALRAP